MNSTVTEIISAHRNRNVTEGALRVKLLTLLSFYFVVSGCSLGPDYTRPDFAMPEAYLDQVSADGSGLAKPESIANLHWWEFFKDPVLHRLMTVAITENRDLQTAYYRIVESRATLGFTRADQFPRIDLSGNASRQESSDAVFASQNAVFNDFRLAGDLSFEIDLWGKLSKATEAQRAELLSTEYAYRAINISIVSEVARSYLLLRDLDARLEIAKRTRDNRHGATELINSRFKGGIVPELDVNQAQIEENEAVVAVAALERERRQTENSLSILLGRFPHEIIRGNALTEQIFPENLQTSFPAKLLERRPDVAAAEEFARAQYARVGVAEAQRLPSLSLLGFVGLNSEDTSDFVGSDAFTWGIGGGLLGPLVDFGKSKSRVEIAKARAQQALKDYEQTVLQAVREVEDALIAIKTFKAEYEARKLQLVAAKNATRLSRARYDDGVVQYLEVLDTERSLFSAELTASSTYQRYLSAIVSLYKALGGGWTPEAETLSVEISKK